MFELCEVVVQYLSEAPPQLQLPPGDRAELTPCQDRSKLTSRSYWRAMKRKVTLTEAQFNFLSDLLKGPRTAVPEWSPGRKLAELGFAHGERGSYNVEYTVTDAGREHHRSIYMADRKCGKCKTAPWKCRVCGRKTCEHHCGRKNGKDHTAVCGRQACQLDKGGLSRASE